MMISQDFAVAIYPGLIEQKDVLQLDYIALHAQHFSNMGDNTAAIP
jgi:hypothetical protein